ncbi:MAG: histidine--tRNA ligase [Dehalococcoidia bacterium]
MADPKEPRRYGAPRGAHDVLPGDWPYWRFVRDTAERVCERFGYSRVDTPIFETAGVYLRTAGEGTDIVEKEVYLFEDRGGERLALRPEGTAGVMRAYLEHGMSSQPQPIRLYYIAPNFRYDRPQAGRYRQHTQFGIEAVGDGDAVVDAEVIDVLRTFYRELGLRDVTLKLNTIGDPVCRPAYIERLRAYYEPLLDRVCADDRMRFEKNPLRLLDCKEERCQEIIGGAPRLSDHLCGPCREHFDALRGYLDALDIGYTIDERLVRGLDYYTRTVFEFEPLEEGSQSSLGAGGRYDGLVELLGGPPTPGVGFGTGLERLILNLRREEADVGAPAPLALYVAHVGPGAAKAALRLADAVRSAGLSAVVGSAGRSLKAQMRQADARAARFVAIIGESELAAGQVTLRDLRDRSERKIAAADVASVLRPGST